VRLCALIIGSLLCRLALGQPSPPAVAYPLERLPFLTWLVDYEPAWSPDGRQIALISNRHGGLKLHLLDAAAPQAGATMRQLTFDSAEDDSPAWSPDGRTLAFVSIRKGVSQLFIIKADGTGLRQLTDGRGEVIHPAWTPDGSRILINTTHFSGAIAPGSTVEHRAIGDSTDDPMDLATISPEGADLRRLTFGGGFTYASYSPDGHTIVHRRILGKVSQIWRMNADGTGGRNLSGSSTTDGWPAWSPDGRRIVFARQVGEGFQLFVMKADGTGVRQLTNASGRFTNPRWSPDGATILCSRGLGSMSLVVFPAPGD
jgi:TolB protein